MGLLDKAAAKIAEQEQAKANGASTSKAAAKEDKINPTEATAKSAKADTAPKSASVDKEPAARAVAEAARSGQTGHIEPKFATPVITLITLAIFAQRIGEALVAIAADLRK